MFYTFARFNEYLVALSDVLDAAKKALPAEKKSSVGVPFGKTVRA